MRNTAEAVASRGPLASDTGFFGHPRGLATLFFTEMWERFSYYGMRAILILFMTAPAERNGLAMPVSKAGAIYGLYTAAVYLMGLPGGWIADRFLGQRRAILTGGIFIVVGQFCLMSPSMALFYLGLMLVASGTGLLKPNCSTVVGQLYGSQDQRRDAGFSIFYMGINLGALISPVICGWVGEKISWRLGFGIAGVGMAAGVIQYLLQWKYLGEAGLLIKPEDPVKAARERKNALIGAGVGLAIAAVCGVLAYSGTITVTPEFISDAVGVGLIAVSIAIFSWLIFGGDFTPIERKRSSAVFILFIASVLFWAIFEQAGTSLNLFAERSTNDSVFGFGFPASWFQSVQPILVIILAPVFALLWLRLGRREPSSPAKFSLGLIFVGLGSMILVPAAIYAASGARVSPMWLITTYFLQTIGELCLSPVGLSAMTKLAPARIGGMMMGIWFVSISSGNYLAGRAASLYESLPLTTLFGWFGGFVVAAGLVLALLVRPTKRLMSGVK